MTSISRHHLQPDPLALPAAPPPARVDPALAASAAALLSALVREEPLGAAAVGLPTSTAPRPGGPPDPDAETSAAVPATWAVATTVGEQVRRRGVFGRR